MYIAQSKSRSRSSLLRGASRVIDLGRAIPPYQVPQRRFPTARESLQRDWEVVGRDLWSVTVSVSRDFERSR